MSADRNAGVLAIWNGCAPGREAVYERWYRTEHLAERVGIDGFVAGWRYAALDGEPRYFTHYETTSPDVLFCDAYLARVNDPTPLTREIMSGVFTDMNRTVCERVLRVGAQRGAVAVTLRWDARPERAALHEDVVALAADDAVLRAELWWPCEAPPAAAAPSAEQALRGPDAGIAAGVLLECATEHDARAIAGLARTRLPGADHAGIYRMLCSLHRRDRA